MTFKFHTDYYWTEDNQTVKRGVLATITVVDFGDIKTTTYEFETTKDFETIRVRKNPKDVYLTAEDAFASISWR